MHWAKKYLLRETTESACSDRLDRVPSMEEGCTREVILRISGFGSLFTYVVHTTW